MRQQSGQHPAKRAEGNPLCGAPPHPATPHKAALAHAPAKWSAQSPERRSATPSHPAKTTPAPTNQAPTKGTTPHKTSQTQSPPRSGKPPQTTPTTANNRKLPPTPLPPPSTSHSPSPPFPLPSEHFSAWIGNSPHGTPSKQQAHFLHISVIRHIKHAVP